MKYFLLLFFLFPTILLAQFGKPTVKLIYQDKEVRSGDSVERKDSIKLEIKMNDLLEGYKLSVPKIEWSWGWGVLAGIDVPDSCPPSETGIISFWFNLNNRHPTRTPGVFRKLSPGVTIGIVIKYIAIISPDGIETKLKLPVSDLVRSFIVKE